VEVHKFHLGRVKVESHEMELGEDMFIEVGGKEGRLTKGFPRGNDAAVINIELEGCER
jgi:hypothetical protein